MSSPERVVLSLLSDIALSCDGAILGLTLAYAAVRSVLKYASSSAALEKIRDANEVSVSDLRSLIPSSDDGSGEIDVGNSNSQRIYMVRGKVKPKFTGGDESQSKVLVSPETGDKALIIHRSQTYMYSRRTTYSPLSNGHRFLLQRSLSEQGADLMRMVPFVMVDSNEQDQSSSLFVNMDGSRQPLPLTTVYNRLIPLSSSPYSFFQALFFPEYPVGLLDVEKILPPGTDLTAVGVCSFNDGVPQIKACQDLPYFLSDMTKDKMVLDLMYQNTVLFWGSVVLGCVSVGILSFAAVRTWNKWKLRNSHRREPPPQVLPNQEPEVVVDDVEETEDTEEIPDGELCVICVSRRRVPAFIPCGHVVCCRRCASTVERELIPKCPVCLQSIRGSMRVYYC